MILSFAVSEIEAKRKKEKFEKAEIRSTPFLTRIKKTKVLFPKEMNVLRIEFEFLTEYRPNIGFIKIKGFVLYSSDKIDEILEFLGSKKILPPEVEIEIKNFLFRKCLTLGIQISENMQLPPPLAFPSLIRKKEKKLDYIG